MEFQVSCMLWHARYHHSTSTDQCPVFKYRCMIACPMTSETDPCANRAPGCCTCHCQCKRNQRCCQPACGCNKVCMNVNEQASTNGWYIRDGGSSVYEFYAQTVRSTTNWINSTNIHRSPIDDQRLFSCLCEHRLLRWIAVLHNEISRHQWTTTSMNYSLAQKYPRLVETITYLDHHSAAM